jgi:2-keto-3-deoxy-L-rhamnonate aldolase RhmA
MKALIQAGLSGDVPAPTEKRFLIPSDARNVRKALQEGYTLVALGLDTVFLQDGAQRALQQAGQGGTKQSP